MKKAAPLIILAIFAIGVYFMVQGMQSVVTKTTPQSEKTTSTSSDAP